MAKTNETTTIPTPHQDAIKPIEVKLYQYKESHYKTLEEAKEAAIMDFFANHPADSVNDATVPRVLVQHAAEVISILSAGLDPEPTEEAQAWKDPYTDAQYKEAAAQNNFAVSLLRRRVRNGWSLNKAATTPIRAKTKKSTDAAPDENAAE